VRTRAAVVEAPGEKLAVVDIEVDDPRPDEVLVRIVASGLCHTDLTVSGMLPAEMFPFVFGHEGAGVVEAVGAEVTDVGVGDHVVLSYRSCRSCARCQGGHPAYCEQHLMLNYIGSRLDGTKTYSRGGRPVSGSFFGQSSFAEHVLAYADNVVVVDRALDLAQLAPYGCGYQTGAGAVLNVLRPSGAGSGESLVVFGAGAVGLAAIAAARGAGVETVVAVDLLPERLAAAERLGAVTFRASTLSADEIVAGVREATSGGATYGVETTAVPQVVRQAVDVLAPAGELVVLGLGAAEFSVNALDLLQNGKVLRGCIEGDSDPHEMIPRLIAANSGGDFDVDGLIQTYAFEDINQAVDDALAGRVVKPVLVW
jgi:aryl-alcohol dehydrogenase